MGFNPNPVYPRSGPISEGIINFRVIFLEFSSKAFVHINLEPIKMSCENISFAELLLYAKWLARKKFILFLYNLKEKKIYIIRNNMVGKTQHFTCGRY